MRQVVRLSQWEVYRLVRRKGLLVLLSLAAIIPMLALAVTAVQNAGWSPVSGELSYFGPATGTLRAVAPFLAIILAGFLHGIDLQGGYCRTLTARGSSRTTIFAAKALVSGSVLLGYHLLVLGMTALVAVALSPHFQDWQEALPAMAASYYSSLLYLGLGILLAHWGQSLTITVGVGAGLIFVESTIYPFLGLLGRSMGWPLDLVTEWTPWGVANGLQGKGSLLSSEWFIPITAGYIGALFFAAVLIFRRSDLRIGSE